jgi:hypothetical protein
MPVPGLAGLIDSMSATVKSRCPPYRVVTHESVAGDWLALVDAPILPRKLTEAIERGRDARRPVIPETVLIRDARRALLAEAATAGCTAS